MAGINHVTGEWCWIPGTRGLKRGCPMKDGKIDNKNKMIFFCFRFPADQGSLSVTQHVVSVESSSLLPRSIKT